MEKNDKKTGIVGKIVAFVIVALAAGTVGYLAHRGAHSQMEMGQAPAAAEETTGKWYCSMHPQIIRDEPGQCPICGMNLIPMPKSMESENERTLVVSEAAAKLMDIETSKVERKFVDNEVRMVGMIAYDETRLKNITAWVGGRIDRLFVDFTGITVRKGDHMVELYSPELVSAQAELVQAAEAVRNLSEGTSELVKRSTRATLEAAREKLRLLGINEEQIKRMEGAAEPETKVTIYSPISGVVVEREATEGMYVKTGTVIYTVADLSKLWVLLDAYESDLDWIRYGQEVEFTTEALPGEVFKGMISFIDPVLDPKTRTVNVRVNVDNSAGKLKPEMFVRAVVRSEIAQGGKVMDPSMAGKWICPMHPSVIRDGPGKCDICGMDLVTTESLGYVKAVSEEPPLVIPASAPLITGKRAVVYLQAPDAEKPTFEGREVVLGPRAGDYYVVKEGLKEGDVVVTSGNFKIDSALQIQAKPSMMSEGGQPMPMMHHHGGEMK
jgi:Cu(I)/Ag(I) efflux system membrane fusion protein